MNKKDLPTTFGIFKPVGHTLIAFHTTAELTSAQADLARLGFEQDSMVLYSDTEMLAQVDKELEHVSPMANFGYELDLIHIHRELAQDGCCFLVVKADTDALEKLVSDMVRSIKPASAQQYGHFMIEDLTEKPPGRVQA
jgi:hypothetical protein